MLAQVTPKTPRIDEFTYDCRACNVSEAVLTVGWGAVRRVDLEPATCSDPDCVADHGYTGTLAAEDFALRISSSADGQEAVDRLLDFAKALSAATVRS